MVLSGVGRTPESVVRMGISGILPPPFYSMSARRGTSSALQIMQSVFMVGFERPVSRRLRFDLSMSQR